MNTNSIWIAVSIAIVAVVAFLVLFPRKGQKENRLSPLAGLAFALVVAGLVFGDNRLLGYGLMGAGAVLAVADMVSKSRSIRD